MQNEESAVGYGKPPRQSQFKKGCSGNPKGRPRGSSNLVTSLQKALNERVVVTENGRRKRISKLEAMFKQLVNKAASGDHRSAQLLMGTMRVIEQRPDSSLPDAQSLKEGDQLVLRQLGERIRRWRQDVNGGVDDDQSDPG